MKLSRHEAWREDTLKVEIAWNRPDFGEIEQEAGERDEEGMRTRKKAPTRLENNVRGIFPLFAIPFLKSEKWKATPSRRRISWFVAMEDYRERESYLGERAEAASTP